MNFYIESSAFENKAFIPTKFTCDGANISPELRWHHIPDGTKSFVLILEDPDAPNGTFVHWIVYNIPATCQSLEEGVKILPSPAHMGINSLEKKEYYGPCPPNGVHNYLFKIYALNEILDIRFSHPSKIIIEEAMYPFIIGSATLLGQYGRAKF